MSNMDMQVINFFFDGVFDRFSVFIRPLLHLGSELARTSISLPCHIDTTHRKFIQIDGFFKTISYPYISSILFSPYTLSSFLILTWSCFVFS
jgi:hypothetical protein